MQLQRLLENGRDLEADNARRVAYIAALRQADAGDFTALLEFVGDGYVRGTTEKRTD